MPHGTTHIQDETRRRSLFQISKTWLRRTIATFSADLHPENSSLSALRPKRTDLCDESGVGWKKDALRHFRILPPDEVSFFYDGAQPTQIPRQPDRCVS